MHDLYKLTAKQTVGSKLPKGTTFQLIVDSGTEVNAIKIAAAIKSQFGLDLPESSCYVMYFEKVRIK